MLETVFESILHLSHGMRVRLGAMRIVKYESLFLVENNFPVYFPFTIQIYSIMFDSHLVNALATITTRQ